jgi:hypothetical protein
MDDVLYDWLDANRQRLMALPSAAAAAEAAAHAQLNIGEARDEEGRELPADKYARERAVGVLLEPLVVKYVCANEGALSYNSRVYAGLYARLEEYYSVGPLARFVGPLANFEAERPKVRVEDNLWIERLSKADMQHLRLCFPRSSPFSRDLLRRTPLWGMMMVDRADPCGSASSGYVAKFSALLLALRLTRPEPVGYRFDVFYVTRPAFYDDAPEGLHWNARPELPGGSRYVLKQTDEARLRRVFRCPSNDILLRKYSMAFSRFDEAYWRHKREDRLIDAWIALESLFMPDVDPREATYRLALRIAYFLGRTPQERLTIDKDVRDSYKLRSDVVHGRSYKQPDLGAATEKTLGYLRAILRALLLQEGELDVERIDRAIRAGKRPAQIK